jgi:hypothetical protein
MEPPTRVSVSIRSELYDEVLRRFLDALHAVNHEEELELVQRGHSEYLATVSDPRAPLKSALYSRTVLEVTHALFEKSSSFLAD